VDYFTTEVESILVFVPAGGSEVAPTVVESIDTVVESVVVASVEALPPHATNRVAIAKIAIACFICLFLCLTNFLNFNKDGDGCI
jgi:hypothetical protein